MKSVVISIDAELSTGYHDYEVRSREQVANYRLAWRWLVNRCEVHSIPCTWAVVGHLMLDSCEGSHADHPSPPDWFESDPGGTERTSPAWFGTSLVESVLDSPVDHDVGAHTFSHVIFDDEKTTPEIADAEVQRCVELADEWGLAFDSFIFPRNMVDHRDVVADHGFTTYRTLAPDKWYDETPIRPIAKAHSYSSGRAPPPIVEPSVDANGLVDIPASLYLFGFEGTARQVLETLSDDPIVRKVRLGLAELSQRDDGVLHLWLHPNNVTTEADYERMERVFRLVDYYRERTDISVETMDEIANAVTGTKAPTAVMADE